MFIRSVVLLLVACFSLSAQDVSKPGRAWSYGMVALPGSATAISIGGITDRALAFVDYLYLSNTSASAVTVTVVDQSTSCNGGACYIANTLSMAANSVYAVPVFGTPMGGGIKWSASTANVVDGYIAGRY